ncbi:MAG TPA: SPOR domain-containing protein [Allosphingosinicella sp.]|uniref:SPOR domain-containing protein n=1 Tax=Allosphingosinicella sp. TaxID=2823234 RepID=UPI002ED90A86
MRKSSLFKMAASPLVLGITMVGCTTAQTTAFRPAASTPKEASAAERAAKFADQAMLAAQKGDLAQALTHAEQAVEVSPRDVGYRMILGDLYLKNGRFLSAKTTFNDVLTLHEENTRARFNLALSQIALGERHSAMVQLDRLLETQSPADLGLAYALAGAPERAIEMLEQAARTPEANARVRQNLALAYAIAGDWKRARNTASQDLSPADLPARMEEWAAFVTPKANYDQVASLLGVTPADDQGQPTRLALAPEPAQPVQMAAVEQPAAPVIEPQPVAEAPVVEPAAAPEPARVEYASAAKSLIAPQPAVQKAALPASAPVAAFKPAAAKQSLEPKKTGTSRYVVQLGAYKSPALAAAAWTSVAKRYGLNAYSPMRATVQLPGKGTFHRLSASGFASQAEALRACQNVKAKGGACFVRNAAGDSPIRLASR